MGCTFLGITLAMALGAAWAGVPAIGITVLAMPTSPPEVARTRVVIYPVLAHTPPAAHVATQRFAIVVFASFVRSTDAGAIWAVGTTVRILFARSPAALATLGRAERPI